MAAADAIAPAVVAVARRAHFVAALVVHVVDAIYARAGIDPKDARSCPLPTGFLFELGAVIQLVMWESAGLAVHVEAGLPSADSAGKDLERRAKLGPSEFADVTRLELWQKVNLVWVQHFGWQGEESFGAEIALVLADDDLLVDALAEFLWTNRNKLRTDIDEDAQS
ncbi:MAG TPA: hypothetical protein VFG04_28845 [Planctomycetaceae bacterium]|jgi:hypothetical protein|nr:hypothetical protein [Planctomycetaceae bacterium]